MAIIYTKKVTPIEVRTCTMLPKNASLRHIALAVNKLDECEKFYNLLGMRTELKTTDYVYLTNYDDNLSLHRVSQVFPNNQRLEHIGFALDSVEAVDQLYFEAKNHNLTIVDAPATFGTGTRSFSVLDPDGIEVEFTYHPPMWHAK
jgi:catechol 2,3-dioxygenase-like lactoylglutathione lyase family enzyme